MAVTLTSDIDGYVEYEIHRSDEFVKEGRVDVTTGEPETIVYSPLVPGYYNYYFYLFNDTGYLRNYTTIMSNEMSRDPVLYEEALCVEGIIAVYGRARDEKGGNLADATIVMRNVDTSETLEATTNESGYAFEIVFPRWMQAPRSPEREPGHHP